MCYACIKSTNLIVFRIERNIQAIYAESRTFVQATEDGLVESFVFLSHSINSQLFNFS
jgi:hypothetical protein